MKVSKPWCENRYCKNAKDAFRHRIKLLHSSSYLRAYTSSGPSHHTMSELGESGYTRYRTWLVFSINYQN